MRVALNITKTSPRERIKIIQREHRAIFNAIAKGDITAADLAMRYHIYSARMRLINNQWDV